MFPALTHPLAETGSKVVKTAFFIANFVEGFSCVVKKPNWKALANSEGADLFPFLQSSLTQACVCREES